MAHAHHFLTRLDRVTRAHTEFALELYRDHEAVAYVLDRVNVPETAERVALSIEDPKNGPFVIVTRNGRFVTCLGEGMSPGACPVIPRPQIDAMLAHVHEMRSRRELAQRELRPHEEEEDLFQRIVSRGSRLTREEFLAVSGFEAMLGSNPFIMLLDFTGDVLREREGALNASREKKLAPSIEKALERHDRLTWSVAHLALLTGAGEKRERDILLRSSENMTTTPTHSIATHAGSTFLLRGAWMAARLGKGVLPLYRQCFESGTDMLTLLDASLGIGAIGLRHASLFAEARGILMSATAAAEANPKSVNLIGRAAFGQWVASSMDDAESNTAATIRCGKDFCVTFSAHLPEGHPLRYAKPEDVPDDLARTAALWFDGDAFDTRVHNLIFGALPLAARGNPEDFYFPREVVRAWFGTWDIGETLARLERLADRRDKNKQEPVHATPRPGRNDPCPCGSGKKWKRCCGNGAPAPPRERT